jgi:hypothetical protein
MQNNRGKHSGIENDDSKNHIRTFYLLINKKVLVVSPRKFCRDNKHVWCGNENYNQIARKILMVRVLAPWQFICLSTKQHCWFISYYPCKFYFDNKHYCCCIERSIIESPEEIPVVCASAQSPCRYYYYVHEISSGGHVEQISSSHQEQAWQHHCQLKPYDWSPGFNAKE